MVMAPIDDLEYDQNGNRTVNTALWLNVWKCVVAI
jgi:hypothetical protein